MTCLYVNMAVDFGICRENQRSLFRLWPTAPLCSKASLSQTRKSLCAFLVETKLRFVSHYTRNKGDWQGLKREYRLKIPIIRFSSEFYSHFFCILNLWFGLNRGNPLFRLNKRGFSFVLLKNKAHIFGRN